MARLTVAGVAVVVAAIGGAVALTGGGPAHLDVVAEARAALATHGVILHIATRYQQTAPQGGTDLVPGGHGAHRSVKTFVLRRELWSAITPTRFREASQDLSIPGAPGPLIQEDYTQRRFRFTVAGSGRVQRQTIPRNDAGVLASQRMAVSSAVSYGPLGSDPVVGLRRMLDTGLIHTAGERTVGGRRLLRLVYRPKPSDVGHGWFFRMSSAGAAGARSFAGASVPIEYLIDPTSFAPVRISYPGSPIGRARKADFGPTITITFETYERLPLNPQTARLLRIDTTGLKVVDGPPMGRGVKQPLRRPRHPAHGRATARPQSSATGRRGRSARARIPG